MQCGFMVKLAGARYRCHELVDRSSVLRDRSREHLEQCDVVADLVQSGSGCAILLETVVHERPALFCSAAGSNGPAEFERRLRKPERETRVGSEGAKLRSESARRLGLAA